MTQPENPISDSARLSSASLRLLALYHSAMSSAAFRRADALLTTDEDESICLCREASSYETCATWINEARGIIKRDLGKSQP